jgi:hypothetical protein
VGFAEGGLAEGEEDADGDELDEDGGHVAVAHAFAGDGGGALEVGGEFFGVRSVPCLLVGAVGVEGLEFLLVQGGGGEGMEGFEIR